MVLHTDRNAGLEIFNIQCNLFLKFKGKKVRFLFKEIDIQKICRFMKSRKQNAHGLPQQVLILTKVLINLILFYYAFHYVVYHYKQNDHGLPKQVLILTKALISLILFCSAFQKIYAVYHYK